MRTLHDGNAHFVREPLRRLDAAQGRMSRHLQVSKQAGLVVDEKVLSAGKVLTAEEIGRLP